MSAAAVEAVQRILELGDEADDTLRAVVAELARQPGLTWCGVLFLEDGDLTLGPEAGVADPSRRIAVPVSYQGVIVGELAVDGTAEPAILEQVAATISTHVLLGWDTGGEAWEP